MSEENTQEAQQEQATEETTSLLDTSTQLADGEYYLSDGVKGSGGKPEWFNSDKFKSVAEQAKGHAELHKAFGSFTGAPKDGYAIPEGVDKEDALYQSLVEFAKESNMSQSGADKAWELLSAQSGVNQEVSAEAEMAKLGDNANERLKSVEGFLKNNLGDKYSDIAGLVNSADAVQLVEAVIQATMPKKLPIDGGENPTGMSWADIEAEMYKKDDNGRSLRSSDPTHNAKVERMIEEFAGSGVTHLAVG